MTEFWKKQLAFSEADSDSSLITDLLITTRLKNIKEKSQFEHPGGTRDSVYFVAKGVIRSYYKIEEYEHTDWFFQEGDMIMDELSFLHQHLTDTYLEASWDSKVIEITKQDYLELRSNHPSFKKLSDSLEADFKKRKNWHTRLLQRVSGLERYELFINKYPKIYARAQVKHLASFIGVTPNTMSRYRKHDISVSKS